MKTSYTQELLQIDILIKKAAEIIKELRTQLYHYANMKLYEKVATLNRELIAMCKEYNE